jgi:hypothetical protein
MGFAVVPPLVLGPLAFLFGFLLPGRPIDSESVSIALVQLIFGTYGAVLLIGLPIHFLLRRLGRYNAPAYLGVTAFCIAAIFGIFALFEEMTPSTTWNPHGILSSVPLSIVLIFVAIGLLCGPVFWCVSIRRQNL